MAAPVVDVFLVDGKAQLVDPDGMPVQVDQSVVSELLDQGYRPESFKEYDKRESIEWDEQGQGSSIQGPIQMDEPEGEDLGALAAFGLGAGSAATFGLSDLAAREAGVTKESLAKTERESPIAHGIGYGLGLFGPALATGGGSLLAKAGATGARKAIGQALVKGAAKTPLGLVGSAATKAGGKVTSGMTKRFMPTTLKAKLAGAAVAGGLEGGALGAGEALHQLALEDEFDPVNILVGAGAGAALGTGFEAISGLMRAGNKGLRKYGMLDAPAKEPPKGFPRNESWGTAEDMAQALKRDMVPPPPPGAKSYPPYRGLSPAGAEEQMALGGVVPRAPSDMPFTTPRQGELFAGPEVQMLSRSPRLRADAEMARKADDARGALAKEYAAKSYIDPAKAPMTNPGMAEQMIGAIGGSGAIARSVGLGFVFGPKAALLYLGIRPTLKVLPKVSRALSRVSGASARGAALTVPAMSASAYTGYQASLTDEALAEYEQRITQDEMDKAVAFGIDPEAAQKAAALKVQSMQFLKEKMPAVKEPRAKDVRSITRGPTPPTPGQRLRFGRYVRAVEDPTVLPKDFRNGRLTPETVEVWERFYQDALKEFRELVRDAIATSTKPLTIAQIRQSNRLMGLPPDSGYVNMIQSNHAAAQEQQQGKPPMPGPSAEMAQAFQTQTQQALG